MKIIYQSFVLPTNLLALTLFVVLSVGCSSSKHSNVDTTDVVSDRLQAALDQAVANGLPGAGLAIRGDKLNFTGVAGVEDTATTVPLTINHRFYLASIGKTYTAVAMLRLAQDGLLNLDDPITTWLSSTITDRIPSSDAITIRSLLNHTSGIVDFRGDRDDWLNEFRSDPARQWTNADVLPFIIDSPLHFEAMTDFRYSNSNYVLAALIAEAASGLSIHEIIRNYILVPLDLQDTLHGQEALGVAKFAHGYADFGGGILDVYPLYNSYGIGDGGMQAAAADLAVFVHRVLTDDSVLNDAMRTELITPPNVGNPPSTYGMGIVLFGGTMPGIVSYGHSGFNLGARADYRHVSSADESMTIAFCANASAGHYTILYDQFMQSVFEILNDAEALQGIQK